MTAALIKRLFEAHCITRVLFLVDRTTLATQTEEAFTEHLTSLGTYRVPRTGERFKPEMQITICTLQTMINEYRHYSCGYFDLIVIDECHRSIYGEFRRVIDHFDAVKIGVTATPLTAMLPDNLDPEDVAFIRDTLPSFEACIQMASATGKDTFDLVGLCRQHETRRIRRKARSSFRRGGRWSRPSLN